MSIISLLPEFITHLEDERQLQPATVRAYRLDLEALHAFLAGKDFNQIELSDLRAYMRYLKEQGRTVGTIRRKLHAISTFYEFQCVLGNAKENLSRTAQRFAPKSKRTVQKRLLTVNEWRTFSNTPGGNLRDSVAWGLLAWLGLRNAELRALRCGDVDLSTMSILIRGKGGHERKLPLPDELKDGINGLLWGQKTDDYLLRGDGGGYWSKDSFRASFKKHLQRCALSDEITPHWLRHTVATHMSDELGVFRLRDWLGHKSTRTTEIYVHAGDKLKTALEHHPLA